MKRKLCFASSQVCLALVLFMAHFAQAQLELVFDVNKASAPDQSNPTQFTALGSTVLFVATSGSEGRELWKTDGTTGNTVLLKDVWLGNQSSSPTILGVLGSTAFFAANDGTHGVELWKTDGTAAGTVMVKDIFPGSESSIPQAGAIVFNGMLYFTAQDYDRNFELWKSDGTAGGTTMVKDLQFNNVNPGSGPSRFVVIGTKLLFLAYTDAPGNELWVTDGTSDGTTMVKEIIPGNSSAYFGPYAVMNNVAYFGTGDGSHGNELWRCDGTSAGTYMVKDISPGSGNAAVGEIIALGTTVYFSAGNITANRELWKSDGTDAGTVLVKEINPSASVGGEPFGFKAIGTTIYFFANNGTNGVELWKTNGTEAGTTLVKDIFPGTGFGAPASNPFTATMLEAIGTTLYFCATDGTSGLELWKSDGTAGGTVLVKDLAAGSASAAIKELKAIGSKVYFAAAPTGGGGEPYVSDGTTGGTGLLKKISTSTAGSTPKELTSSGSKLFFTANDGVNGRELWVVDETGAHLTRMLNTNTADSSTGGLGALNGTVFFGSSTNSFNSDYQLFRSDGTSDGTFLVGLTPPLSGVALLPGCSSFTAVGNLGFFIGNTVGFGSELWRTDGTAAGTFLLKDFKPGPETPQFGFGEMTSIGSTLYMVGNTPENGKEVWKSNGTPAGTLLVKGIGGGWTGSDPYGLCPFGNTLYFSADGPDGSELYKTNGTAAGTALVKDIADGSSFAAFTTPLNSTTLLFTAFRQAEGTELWKTNGTAAGTVLVKNIRPGSFPNILGTFTGYGSNPFGLVQRGGEDTSYGFAVINGVAYFSADDGSHGRELWKSDGTDAGTVMVKDIAPGVADSSPSSMVVIGDKIYFVVTLSGATQLWKSNGTEVGTVMVEDQVQSLDRLTLCGTSLYMVGSQSAIGTELFKLANVRTAPFAISQSPLPLTQTLAPGATVTYTAAATAVSGVTLTYQWRRNGLGIPGATKATYTFKAAENLEGTYDLLVRSGDFELISGAAQLSVTDPAKIAITQQPLARLARVFDPVTFKVSVVGQSPSFQWYKGAVPIPGATTSVLSLPFVFNADAGLYKVKVSNSLGSVFSAAVPLVLVGSTDTNLPVKNLTTATMKAPVIGAVSGLTYQWLSGSSALTNGAFNKRINGVTTPTLTFTKFTSADRYFFTCVVTMGSQSVLSGRIYPQVADIPIIAVKPSPPTWIISGGVFQFASSTLFTQSNLTGKPWNFPTIYNITGLPLGMTYDTKTGLITGRPQAGGGTSITLKIKVGNVAGTMTTALTVTIPIETFPALVKGAFRGLADRSTTTLNDNLGNYFQADVTALGSLSGKLFRGTTAYPFTTRFVDTTTGSLFATADVKISRPGTTPLTLTIVFDGNTGAVTGNLTDGTDTTPITGVRSPWIATGVGANPATAYAKAYTAALQLPDAQTGDGAYPQGDAYAVASITNAGAASGAVRLADGTKVTFSTLLGGAGQLPLHVGAYANTGSLHGWSTITSGTGNWDGIPGFFKAMQRRESTTRSYKSGVPLHTLTLIGGTWTKPTAAALLLGVTDSGATVGANNARIEFTEGGISSSHLAVAGKYAVPLRIKAPASAFVLPPVAGNPGKLTLAFATLLTGEITGTFTTTDANPNGGAAVPRTVSYYGVIVQRLNRGRGHFNLARLPDDFEVNPLKTGIIGGLMELSASQ